MYVPRRYEPAGLDEVRAFIDAHPFAMLVTAGDGGAPVATHIPLLLEVDPAGGAHDGDAHVGDRLTGRLLGHLAHANPQWRTFDGVTAALAVFHGPHAYVSPAWYAGREHVPTWNYVAVHVTGAPEVVTDAAEHLDSLRRLVERFEAPGARAATDGGGWSMEALPADYLERMRRGTVAFTMPVERIEAAFKLNQNRDAADRGNVAAMLEASHDGLAQETAALMRRLVLE